MIFSSDIKSDPLQFAINPEDENLSFLAAIESAHTDKTRVAEMDKGFLDAVGEFETAGEEVSKSFAKRMEEIGTGALDALLNRTVETLTKPFDWYSERSKKAAKETKARTKARLEEMLAKGKISEREYKHQLKISEESPSGTIGAPAPFLGGMLSYLGETKDILRAKMGEERYREVRNKIAVNVDVPYKHKNNPFLGFSIGLTKSNFLTDEFINWKGEGAAKLEQGVPHLMGTIVGMGLMLMATRKAMSKVPAYQKLFIPDKTVKEITPPGKINLAKVFRETERLSKNPRWFHGNGILYKGLEVLKEGNALKVQRLSNMAYRVGTMLTHATEGAVLYGGSDLINKLGSKTITGEEWNTKDTEELIRKMQLGAGMTAIGGYFGMKAWPVLGKIAGEEISQIGLGFLFSLSQIQKERGEITKEDFSGAMLYELLEEIPELGLTFIMPLLGGTSPLGMSREASLESAKRNLNDSFRQLLKMNYPETKNDIKLLTEAETLTRSTFEDLKVQTQEKYNRLPTMRETLNMVKDIRRQIQNKISSKPLREKYRFRKDLYKILEDNPEQLSILRQLDTHYNGLKNVEKEDIEVAIMLGAIEGAEVIKPTDKGGQKRVKIALSEPLSGDMDFVVDKIYSITQKAVKAGVKFPEQSLRSEVKDKLISYRVPTRESDGRMEASRGKHMPRIDYEAIEAEHLSRNQTKKEEIKEKRLKTFELGGEKYVKKVKPLTQREIDLALSRVLQREDIEFKTEIPEEVRLYREEVSLRRLNEFNGKEAPETPFVAEGKLTDQEFNAFMFNWTRKTFGIPLKFEDLTTHHLDQLKIDMEVFDRMGDTWSYLEKMGYINPNNDFAIDNINSNILHKIQGLPKLAAEFGWADELSLAKARSVMRSQDWTNVQDDVRMILAPLGKYRLFRSFQLDDKIVGLIHKFAGSTDHPKDYPIKDLQTDIYKESKKLVPLKVLEDIVGEYKAYWTSDKGSKYFKGKDKGWHNDGIADLFGIPVEITLKNYSAIIHEIAAGKDPAKIVEHIKSPNKFIRKSGSKGIPKKVWEERGYVLGKKQVDVYLSRMLNEKYYGDLVEAIRTKLYQNKAPESARVVADDFLKSLKGEPVDIAMRNMIANGLNKMPFVNLTSDDVPRLVNTGLNFIYAGGLGLRASSAIKNLFQGPMNNPPGMSSLWWMKGLWRTWYSKEYRDLAHEKGIFRTYSLPGLYEEYSSPWAKVLNKSLAAFIFVDHYCNRVPVYLGARAQLEHYYGIKGAQGLMKVASRQPEGIRPEFERAGRRLEQLDKMMQGLKVDSDAYGRVRDRFDFEMDKIAHLYGFLQQANSNWEYGKFGRPHYLQGIGGRLGFTFMSWGSWYYGTYMHSLLKYDKPGFARHIAKGSLMIWLMSKFFGMNMKPWLLTGPLPTKPYGPIPQTIFNAAQVVQAWNYGHEDMRIRAMDDLKRSSQVFIPGWYAYYDWISLIREFQREFPCYDSRTGLLQYEPNMKKALSDFFGVTDYYNQTNQAADLLRGATIEEYEKGRKVAEKWDMVPYSKQKKKRGIKGVGGIGGVKGIREY